MRISIIIPVLNESEGLPDLLGCIMPLCGREDEVIVSDGGSEDGSGQIALRMGARVVCGDRGRARQMNAGAAVARGDILMFLHADTLLPHTARQAIESAIRCSGGTQAHVWGRFDVRIAGQSLMLRMVAALMNWRSRFSGIATGDQAIFMTRTAFDLAGGFPDQPLMEDIELSKRLRVRSKPICLVDKAVTSGRRWESHGIWRTIWLMWRLRWLYWRGAPVSKLARSYR